MVSSRPLTALADARAALLAMLTPVAAQEVPCAQAPGLIAGPVPQLAAPVPPLPVALRDGYALAAEDLAGASSFSPAILARAPSLVRVGDPLPQGCDCVVDAQSLDLSGPVAQAFVESFPGENVRRTGEDFAAGATIIPEGRKIAALDLLPAARAGLASLPVRRPRVLVLNVPAESRATCALIAELARDEGAQVAVRHVGSRGVDELVVELRSADADIVLVIGGTGAGADDAAAEALAAWGEIIAHGLALEPGRTCALARAGALPAVALPGSSDQAFACFHALVRPALDRLAARLPRIELELPLAAKIASRVGLAELALLVAEEGRFVPLAVGDLPLQFLSRATHVALIAAGSEGRAAGDLVAAQPLRS